jgi:hypothetical protein
VGGPPANALTSGLMRWRPLSKRGVADPRLDEPAEGIPPWMQHAVSVWVARLIVDTDLGGAPRRARIDLLHNMEMKLRMERPLNFSNPTSAVDDLFQRMQADDVFALDVIDYLLGNLLRASENRGFPSNLAEELDAILSDGGSAWEVADLGRSVYALQRRSVGPIREAIAGAAPSSRAGEHLSAAWNRLVGRSPDASSAYREAVRAVEAAAKPVILPNNPKATLGTMIAAMRDKPEKWLTSLGTVDELRQMMEMLWTNQLDRHGTDDEDVPLNVTLEQADVAVHLALTLTRLFVGGHVRPAQA